MSEITENTENADSIIGAAKPGEGLLTDVDASTDASDDAKLKGETLRIPDDLYIPPGYMRVLLETFQGPLDLLLYLIRKSKIDILDLNVTAITKQYMEYIEVMQELKMDLAAEYLLMAATLIDIKSRLLLPRPSEDEEAELDDPRAELVRRLRLYELFRDAAINLDQLSRQDRDFFVLHCAVPDFEHQVLEPEFGWGDALKAMASMYRKQDHRRVHQIEREVVSVRERMLAVLDAVQPEVYTEFSSLYQTSEGSMGVVVSLLAILELQKQRALEIMQRELFANIYIRKPKVSDEHRIDH